MIRGPRSIPASVPGGKALVEEICAFRRSGKPRLPGAAKSEREAGDVALGSLGRRGGGMQIRKSCFIRADGCQQPECNGTLHGHGSYSRYSDPDGYGCFEVPRYCCNRCRLTISVLADNRLPYRPVAAEELEAAFDGKAQVLATMALPAATPTATPTATPIATPIATPAPPSEKKSGCFDRAWTAWNRNSRQIAELIGHKLPRAASEDAAQCWRSLRETLNIKGILSILWTRFKTSLLRDYGRISDSLQAQLQRRPKDEG